MFVGTNPHVRGCLVVNLFRILIELHVGVSACLAPVQNILLLFRQEAGLS